MDRKTHKELITFEATIPDGYQNKGYRRATKGERYLGVLGQLMHCINNQTAARHIVVEKLNAVVIGEGKPNG